MKDKFLKILTENVHREGAEKLVNWLENSDFFVAPASTKYHGSYTGGLCEHSINVYERLLGIVPADTYSDETLAIVSLLHDVCKANYYVTDYRNAKNDRGMWEKVPYYKVDEKFAYGHSEKSVYIINEFMRLNKTEAQAIRGHMGFTDASGIGLIGDIFEQCPLAIYLHTADLWATYIDEKRG
jgi:hypothetical protein